MLLAPAIGLFTALFIREKIAEAIAPDSMAALAAACVANEGAEICLIASLTTILQQASVGLLVASLLLPALYVLAVRSLSTNRDSLARAFPGLTRGYLILVALLLVLQAGLVVLSGADLMWTQASDLYLSLRLNLYLLVALGVLAVGLLASAVSILSDLSRALAVEPVQVTAVVAGPELAALEKRVQGVAEKLGVAVPDHIIVGIEPKVFVTTAPVRLRGNGELGDATTLYVPAPLLRVMSAAELDGVLARELSLLSESPDFTGKFVPMSASVTRVSMYVEQEGEEKGALGKLARIPASGFLAAMQSALRSALRGIREKREAEADRAALQVTEAKALLSGLTKIAALDVRWQTFRHAYELYMLRGKTRRNLSLDLLAHVAQYAATNRTTLRDTLIEARTPHAFDVNDTLAERAEAQSIQIAPIVADTVAHLTQAPKPSNVLTALEERITTLENEYFRVPGRRVAVNQEEALPAELAPAAI